MKKVFLNKLVLVFSVILVFVYGIIFACAGGDWNSIFDNSSFTPETFADKSYSPLFLSGDVFYGIGFDDKHNYRFNDQITADWQTYLKGEMNPDEVKAFLLEDERKIKVEELHFYFQTKKKNESSIGFASKINLKGSKTKKFIEFLFLAQQIETVSVAEERWSYEPVVTKNFEDIKFINDLEKMYRKTNDDFLKNRYWFQVIKAYFYSSDKQKAIDFFNKTEASVPKNALYYRAVSYLAGIHYKQKNYAISNYLYSQVFDKCSEMRVVAAYSFHPQENTDWNQSLQMAKTNKEKAALWAIRGFYNDEEEAIEKIHQLDPKSEHLNYLLTRLINSQEQKINKSFEVIKADSVNYNIRIQTIAENKKENLAKINTTEFDLVAKIATAENTSNPFMWNLALGYLQTLKGEYNKAEANFDIAEKKLPKTALATNQLRLLRFVNNLNKIDKLNSHNEQTILKDLHWLYQELPETQKYDDAFRYQKASAWSKAYLASLYREQSNLVMAELFGKAYGYYWNNEASFYDNEKDLLAMKAFLAKKNKTELEQIGADIYSLKLSDISNFQAIKATFQNKIPEAIAFMKENKAIGNFELLGNPFNGNIKDCHDCEHQARQKRKYTEMDFLNLINEMQTKVSQNEDVYNNSLLLGNAFYNISHFGNARTFYEKNIVGYGSSPSYFREPMKRMILDCSVSKSYYRKALAAATTKEQKAKCEYLLAKCERNDFYNNRYYFQNKMYWDFYDDKINFKAWNGFQKLQNEYSDTKYYQDVIRECGYFNTYVEQL